MEKQTVIITLEEYKEFILKDKPEEGREIVRRIVELMKKHVEHSSSQYDTTHVDNMRFEDYQTIIKEIVRILKYLDVDSYLEIQKEVIRKQREKEERKND